MAIEPRLLDLRDFPMPFFDQAVPPASPGRPAYENEVVKKWTAAIGASDGFIFVTPEYNYGPPSGAEERDRLGLSGVEPQGGCFRELWRCRGRAQRAAAPGNGDRDSARPDSLVCPYPVATLMAHFQGGDVDKGLAELEKPASVMIDDLFWWTTGLKAARKA